MCTKGPYLLVGWLIQLEKAKRSFWLGIPLSGSSKGMKDALPSRFVSLVPTLSSALKSLQLSVKLMKKTRLVLFMCYKNTMLAVKRYRS